MRFGEETTPAILECGGDWKVSPNGPDDPDTDCFWVDTKAEAVEECSRLLRSSMAAKVAECDRLRAAALELLTSETGIQREPSSDSAGPPRQDHRLDPGRLDQEGPDAMKPGDKVTLTQRNPRGQILYELPGVVTGTGKRIRVAVVLTAEDGSDFLSFKIVGSEILRKRTGKKYVDKVYRPGMKAGPI